VSEATFKQKIIGQLNALFMPCALDLLNFRIHHYDRSVDPARPEYNEHVIYYFWHEYILFVLPRWGHTPVTVLCSQHRDGEWVHQTAESLGLNIVRGSSTRGGSAAIRQMKKNSQFSSIAMTPDGPRGPRREMALGPVYLASLLGLPLVPIAVGISNPRRLNTWDKFAIPRPTSRVRLIFGPKIYIPPKTKRDKLESSRVGVQKILNDLSDEAQSWADTKRKMVGEQHFVRCRRENKLVFENKPSPKLKLSTLDQSASSQPDRRVG
jgi:lysophospholipid acyltransferase (LPLAT)-like uncharacterized protein